MKYWLKGIGGTFIGAVKRILRIGHDDAGWIEVNGKRFVVLDVAITADVTTTTHPDGTEGRTTHATGAGKIFTAESGKWQEVAGSGEGEPGGGQFLSAEVQLDNDDILTLSSVPFQIIPTAGPGTVIVLVRLRLEINTLGGAYAGVGAGDKFACTYGTDWADDAACESVAMQNRLQAQGRYLVILDQPRHQSTPGQSIFIRVEDGVDDKGIFLRIDGADPTGGHVDNFVKATCLYEVVTLS